MSRFLSVQTLRRIDSALPSAFWSIAIPAAIAFSMLLVLRWIPRPPLNSIVQGFRPPVLATDFALRPPRVLADGAIALRWRALRGAEGYELRLYDSELDELARLASAPDTVRFVHLSDLAGAMERGQILVYRVHALRGEEEIGRSEVGTCRVP